MGRFTRILLIVLCVTGPLFASEPELPPPPTCPKQFTRLALLKALRDVVRNTEVHDGADHEWSLKAREHYADVAANSGIDEYLALASYMKWLEGYHHKGKAPTPDAVRFSEGFRVAWFPAEILGPDRQRIPLTGNDTTENSGGLFTYWTTAAQLIDLPQLFADNILIPRVRVAVNTAEELTNLLKSPNLAFIPSLVLDFTKTDMPYDRILDGLAKGEACHLVTELRLVLPTVSPAQEKESPAETAHIDMKPFLTSSAWRGVEILSVAVVENSRQPASVTGRVMGLEGFVDDAFALPDLTQVRFHATGITGDRLAAVFSRADFKAKGLTTLKLNSNPLGLAGAQGLWAKHGSLPSLEVLDLSGTGMNAEAIEWFVSDVAPHPNLRKIYLRENALGATGIQTLRRWGQTLPSRRPYIREWFGSEER